MPHYELNEPQCLDLLQKERIVRVAFDSNGEIYLIPLGYVWLEGSLCGMTDAGRKTAMAAKNPRVSFQLDNSNETGPFGWRSITGEADFEIVADTSTIERLAPAVFRQFADGPEWALDELGAKADQGKVVFYRLVPRTYTGRAFTEHAPA